MKVKKVFQVFDHCSIYLLITGTYTHFCLLIVHGKRLI
ncbi:TPA: hemolysin III family protein [Enterococcus faecium]